MTDAGPFDFVSISLLAGSQLGPADVPCPACGPRKDRPSSQRRKVMRVWQENVGFLTYFCARCGVRGWAADGSGRRVDRHELSRRMRLADARNSERVRQRSKLARYLWDASFPIQGSPAGVYIRARGIRCAAPETLRYLPARGQHPPALLAAFGVPSEPIPGSLDVRRLAVNAVHVTKLRPDGRGKADVDPAKIMVGASLGLPIVLAPANDIGGLAIAEGLEDALSLHEATGLGAWAAGCANRLPALAPCVPSYVSAVTISVDDDEAGRHYAGELAQRLVEIRGRRFEVTLLQASKRAAA